MSYFKSFLFGLCFLLSSSMIETSLGYDADFQGRIASIPGQVVFSTAQEESQSDNRPVLQNSCLIQGATIHTPTGEGTLVGDILVRKGKIVAVAPKIELRRPLPVIDASGLHAVPGFIDSQSSFLLDLKGNPSSKVQADALDAFDFFDEDRIVEALSRGVTAECLTPPVNSGFGGRASVVKLLPNGSLEDLVLKRDAALEAGVGAPGPGRTLSRIKTVKGLAKQLAAAGDYKELWDDYKEELKTYLEALDAGKDEKASDKGDSPDKEPDKEGDKADSGSKPTDEGKADKDKPDSPEPKPKEDGPKPKSGKSATAPRGDEKFHSETAQAEASSSFEKKEDKKESDGGGPNGKAPNGAKKEEDANAPKKPQKPAYDIAKEWLVKALDGEAVLLVEVDRAADILAVLELAEKYTVDLVLVGCTEGYMVIDAIEEAGVPVILGQSESFRPNAQSGLHNQVPDLAARFQARGIPFAISSAGADARATRYLALNAADAAGHGLDPEIALEAITCRPAEILGVADRIGSIAKGKDADIVLFSKAPLDSDACVERVLINGMEVYSREK